MASWHNTLPGIAFAAAPFCAQAEGSTPELGASLVQVVLGLAAVLALLVGGLYVLKRLSAPRGAAAGLLRVVAAAAVGPRERVVLVEVGDTWIAVGVAPGRVNALHTLPRQSPGPMEPSAGVPAGKDFGTWLNQLVERKGNAR